MSAEPELSAAAEQTVRELEIRLRSYLPDATRRLFCERFIRDLMAERWRHVPAPVDWKTPVDRPDPEVTSRGAAAARAALLREER